MKTKLLICLILLCLVGSTGCRRHRSSGSSVRITDTRGYSLTDEEANERYENSLEKLADSNNYDAIIKALEQGVVDLNNVNKAYRKGNMTQQEFEEHLHEISEMYEPLMEALGKAQEDGQLNFKQQKKVVALIAKFAKCVENNINGYAEELFR